MRGGGNTSWRGVRAAPAAARRGAERGHARGKCVRRAYVKVACVECPPRPANPPTRIPSLHPGSSSPARSSPVERQQCVFECTAVSRSTDEDEAGETPGSYQWREAKCCRGALRDGCPNQILSCARLYLLQRGSRSEAVRQARSFHRVRRYRTGGLNVHIAVDRRRIVRFVLGRRSVCFAVERRSVCFAIGRRGCDLL